MHRDAAFRRRWQMLAVLCLSLVLIGLDNLVLNLALPSIQRDLDATVTELQWVIDAYTLAFGGLLLLAGGLADRFGRKRVLITGLVVFLVSSLGAAFAASAPMLIAFRAAMGVGAALMMPSTLAIIKDVFPVEELGKAIGIWSGAAAVGVPLGPAASGLLLAHFWWGSVFLINVPVAAAALLAGTVLIPESRDREHPGLDLTGAALSVAGLVAVVYGLVEAPRYGWVRPVTLAALAAGMALFAGFIVWERRAAHPMLSARLFRNARYAGGALTMVCVAFGLFSVLFLSTQYLQFVLGFAPLSAGVRMLAIGTVMVAAPLSPHLVARLGLKFTTAAGLALFATGLGVASAAGVSSDADVLWGLAIMGLGGGIALPAAADAILIAAPGQQAGAGSAVADTSMQVGGTLGIAVTGSVLSTIYRDALPSLAELPRQARDAVRDSIGKATAVAGPTGDQPGRHLLRSVSSAFVHGLGPTLWISVAITALGALTMALILPHHRDHDVAPREIAVPEATRSTAVRG